MLIGGGLGGMELGVGTGMGSLRERGRWKLKLKLRDEWIKRGDRERGREARGRMGGE